MLSLLIATRNRGKLREFSLALEDLPVRLVTLEDWPHLPVPEETGSSFLENARLKADYYSHRTSYPALADDSGLEVDLLDGQPGVHSSRFGRDDADRMARLLALLKEPLARGEKVAARFRCALSLQGPELAIDVEGTLEGRILPHPRGSGGFGYDPVFLHPPSGRSLAEMETRQKNRISHRARALALLRERLAARLPVA